MGRLVEDMYSEIYIRTPSTNYDHVGYVWHTTDDGAGNEAEYWALLPGVLLASNSGKRFMKLGKAKTPMTWTDGSDFASWCKGSSQLNVSSVVLWSHTGLIHKTGCVCDGNVFSCPAESGGGGGGGGGASLALSSSSSSRVAAARINPGHSPRNPNRRLSDLEYARRAVDFLNVSEISDLREEIEAIKGRLDAIEAEEVPADRGFYATYFESGGTAVNPQLDPGTTECLVKNTITDAFEWVGFMSSNEDQDHERWALEPGIMINSVDVEIETKFLVVKTAVDRWAEYQYYVCNSVLAETVTEWEQTRYDVTFQTV